MEWSRKRSIGSGRARQFATYQDFCSVFHEEVDVFYQLSFLLMGSHERAENCLLAALEECWKSDLVFRHSVFVWAKYTIIRQAVRLLQPSPSASKSTLKIGTLPTTGEKFELEDLLGLPAFD